MNSFCVIGLGKFGSSLAVSLVKHGKQVMVIDSDADKVNAYAVEAMNWAGSVGLINGVAEGELAPQGNATRAQIATILMRYCEG